jgi:pyridinium-3,5-bisthiocarboxylic acid mononucleotide nickel chelatase
MRIAYFDCFSGISGDMTLGAFLDAGLSMKALSRELARLNLKGYALKKTDASRGSLSGTQFHCVAEGKRHGHRPLKEILNIIEKSPLKQKVKSVAKDIFMTIGRAEGRVHRHGQRGGIYLHELGDIDSIVDIVGTAIALDELGIEDVYSSKVTLGRGFVDTRHGSLPLPAPAAVEILKGVPLEISNVEAELVTPTGAGILKTLSKGFGRMPQMEIGSVGYGAGSDDIPGRPNMLRVLIGEKMPVFKEDRIAVIETNIDDMSPQNFEYLFERLFREGALDVYTTVIQMKKSRSAFKLTVLCNRQETERLAAIIFSETTTIGVRFYEADRFKLYRKMVKVRTKYGDIKVKVSGGAGGALTASPEYDECAGLARKKKVPLKLIYDEAKNAAVVNL